MQTMGEFQKRLSTQPGTQNYLLGTYSLADISVFLTMMFASTPGLSAGPENVSAWLERMTLRPASGAEQQAILTAAATL